MVGNAYTDGPAYDLSAQAIDASRDMSRGNRTAKVSGVVPGCLVCMQIANFSQDVTRMFVKRTEPPAATEDNQKFYWDIGTVSNSTASWSGGWTMWVERDQYVE
jgi:hypothetical protein